MRPLVGNCRYQIPDTRYQIPDTRYQVPDTRCYLLPSDASNMWPLLIISPSCHTLQNSTVLYIIQVLKVMYLSLTLQVPSPLPSVFYKTDYVFLKEDTRKCVFNNTCPRACISQYSPMGVYWLVQALGHVLCNKHS